MGFWENKEKGYGTYKQSKLAGKDYITTPGTRMGVGSAFDQNMHDAYMQELMAGARGELPSAAQSMMQSGLGSLARGMGSAALTGGSGMGAALGARTAAQQGGQVGLQNIHGAAALRAEEMDAFRNQLGQAYGQRISLEDLMGRNYATAMGSKRDVRAGAGQQLLGASVGAGGAIAGGALAGR